MIINRDCMNVGTYYVLQVDMREGSTCVLRYHADYEAALTDATNYYTPDYGHRYLVVEVQGIIQGQGIPEVTTSLTRKL